MQGGRDELRARIDAALGSRVALRHRIGEREGRPLFTDAVGMLGDAGSGEVVVETRSGPVQVRRDAVVAVRVVPPAPDRRPSWSAVARLENLCADAWPALVDEPLGAWRLRAADGFTARANSALAVGDPGLPAEAALDRVRSFAAAHGIGPRLQTPVGSPWSRAAQRASWVLDVGHAAGAEVDVLVADLTLQPAPTVPVEFPAEPSADWWALAGDPAGRHVLTAAAQPGFGLLPGRGAIRAAVVEDHLHLSRLWTAPEARRTGVGTALTLAAAAWGCERGARWGVLQVATGNAAALALYERLGWQRHHRYHHLVPS